MYFLYLLRSWGRYGLHVIIAGILSPILYAVSILEFPEFTDGLQSFIATMYDNVLATLTAQQRSALRPFDVDDKMVLMVFYIITYTTLHLLSTIYRRVVKW